MARSPIPKLFLVIALLAFTLLIIPHDAIGALDQHCCDLRAVNPPGLWYPDPPVCALIGLDCILDPAVYNFCGLGAGDYETRSFWPSPPDAIQQSATTPYWCRGPVNDVSMDPGASGPVTPCDQNTDCTASGNCYDTGNVDADRDGDTDSDYCLSGMWFDCNTDVQCLNGYHCSASNCIPNTEINCNNGIDDDGDTFIDIADSDCSGSCANSGENNWWVLGQGDCNQCDYAGSQDGDTCSDADDANCGGTELICDDTLDNDCDGVSDWSDSDCSGLCGNTGEDDWFVLGDSGCNHCTDSVNNDGDAWTDYDDPDCCAECISGGWGFDLTGGSCGGALDFIWEFPDTQVEWCCGNEPGVSEFYVTTGEQSGCCDTATDCVDALGTCRIGSEFSPGGCTDPYDHDCDGKNNYDDEDCRDTIYGIVTDDGTPAKPIENAAVTAVATDPVTGIVVQYSNVTNVLGNYLMNVTKGLDYDIVVVVPGYGTGFVWDHGPGNIDFNIKKAENCEDDCTSPGESLCRPECNGINGCSFYGVGGAGGTRTCDGAQKDWIIPYFYDTDYELQCCEGAPVPRKRAQVVGVSGAESVVRVTRIISYGGQLITLVIDMFK